MNKSGRGEGRRDDATLDHACTALGVATSGVAQEPSEEDDVRSADEMPEDMPPPPDDAPACRSASGRRDRRTASAPRDARGSRGAAADRGDAREDVVPLAPWPLVVDGRAVRVEERRVGLQGQGDDPRSPTLGVGRQAMGVPRRGLGQAGDQGGRRIERRPAPGGPDVASNAEAAPATSDNNPEPQAVDDDGVRVYGRLRGAADPVSGLAPSLPLPLVSPASSLSPRARVSPRALPPRADAPQSALSASQQPEPREQPGRMEGAASQATSPRSNRAPSQATSPRSSPAPSQATSPLSNPAPSRRSSRATSLRPNRRSSRAASRRLSRRIEAGRARAGTAADEREPQRRRTPRRWAPLAEQAYRRRTRTPTYGANHQRDCAKKLPLPVNEYWKPASM